MVYYIGFGSNCDVSEIMNRGGIRHESLPFDFLFAYPCHIKRSLDVDFEDWLDPQYLELLNRKVDKHPLTKHTMYDSHAEELRKSYPYSNFAFFNHHNLLSEKHRGIFERRINRYKTLVQSKQHLVFITNSKIETMIDVGLHSYYSDRDGKATMVYLDYLGAGDDFVEAKAIDDYLVVQYRSYEIHGDSISKMICDEVTNFFGG